MNSWIWHIYNSGKFFNCVSVSTLIKTEKNFQKKEPKMFLRVFSRQYTANFVFPKRTKCLLPYGLDSHWFILCMYDQEEPSMEVCEVTNKMRGVRFVGPRLLKEDDFKAVEPRTPWIRVEWNRTQWLRHVFHVSQSQHNNKGLGMPYLFHYNCQKWCARVVEPFYDSLFTISEFIVVVMYMIGFAMLISIVVKSVRNLSKHPNIKKTRTV